MDPNQINTTDHRALIAYAETGELIDAINRLMQLANKCADVVGRGTGGRELSLSITNLQQAHHWAVDAHELLHIEARG